MPRAIRKGIDLSVGHVGNGTVCSPIGEETVLVGGLPAVKQGDIYQPHHECPTPDIPRPVLLGSLDTFIGGFGIVREGDLISCGDTANSEMGSDAKVFVNESSPAASRNLGNSYIADARISTFPIVRFPNNMTFTYQVTPDAQRNFIRGCPVNIPVEQAYTEILVDGMGVFRNYPGRPFTDMEGIQNPPPNLPEYFSNPIKIGIQFISLPPGWYFEDKYIRGTSFGIDRTAFTYKTGFMLPSGDVVYSNRVYTVIVRFISDVVCR